MNILVFIKYFQVDGILKIIRRESMKMKNLKYVMLFLALCLLFTGCQQTNSNPTGSPASSATQEDKKTDAPVPTTEPGGDDTEDPGNTAGEETVTGDVTTDETIEDPTTGVSSGESEVPGTPGNSQPGTKKPTSTGKVTSSATGKTTSTVNSTSKSTGVSSTKTVTTVKTATVTTVKTATPVPTVTPPPYRAPVPAEVAQNANNYYTDFTRTDTVASGVSWPNDQALPIFSVPTDTLDSISTASALTLADERITFSSLQGLVNKSKTRILITESGDVAEATWATTLGFTRKGYTTATKYDLFTKYKDVVKGIVLYDVSKSNHYRNLASTIANVKGYIPVTAAVKANLETKAGLTFTSSNTVDITGLTYTTATQIYDYMYENYWAQCTKRLIISANPASDLDHNRDIAAAVGAAVVYCNTSASGSTSGTSIGGKLQYEKFIKDMADTGPTAIAMGWFESERSGVTAATRYGVGTLPGDYYISGSVYSSTSHVINIPTVPKRAALENKAYITIYLSDGDNIQYAQRAMRKYWDNEKSARGKVAINWTIAPGLADIGPGLMNYYYDQASDYECFVTGPSGMGYIMPYNSLRENNGAPTGDYLTSRAYADKYTKLTETYLQKAGLRVITVWDGAAAAVRASYEANCRNLNGITVQNFSGSSVSASTENNRLRFDLLRTAYSDASGIRSNIGTALNNWSGSAPLFLSYQLNRWSVSSADIVNLEATLKTDYPTKNFEIVRADHYFSYYNEQNNLPFNLNMLSATKVTSSDSAGNPANVVDGTPNSMWVTSKTGEQYLQFDFGKDYKISRYILRNAEGGGMHKNFNTRSWKVETSTNGSSWTLVDTYKSNVSAVVDMEFTERTARYVKITILDGGDQKTTRIADVEIYGKK